MILLPSLYMTQFENSDVDGIAFVLALAYPVLDTIVLGLLCLEYCVLQG